MLIDEVTRQSRPVYTTIRFDITNGTYLLNLFVYIHSTNKE